MESLSAKREFVIVISKLPLANRRLCLHDIIGGKGGFMYQETVDLSHLPPEGRNIARSIHPDAWSIAEKDWTTRGNLVFEIFLQGNGLKTRVVGTVQAEVTANCSRCLAPVPLDLKRRFHLTYLAPDPERLAKEEVELSDPELEMSYLENPPYLSLHQMIREQVYLALPMKVLCRADCKGLCANCGADLNQVQCDCPQEQTDPRWAKLKLIITNTPEQ